MVQPVDRSTAQSLDISLVHATAKFTTLLRRYEDVSFFESMHEPPQGYGYERMAPQQYNVFNSQQQQVPGRSRQAWKAAPLHPNDSQVYGHSWQQSYNALPTAGGPTSPPREKLAPNVRRDGAVARGMNQGAALCDNIATRFGDIFGSAGNARVDSEEQDEFEELADLARGLSLVEADIAKGASNEQARLLPEISRARDDEQQANKTRLVNFKKTWMYSNSRLPPYQYPFRAYFETWRVICMAARASAQVYQRPRVDQREHYVDASWRHGTKAMVVKSSPIDDKNLIVFAIRGSQKNFMDWAVNFRPAPTAPEGFLDDPGNACHAGFLSVAKAMVAPVAQRLRQLLEQDPSRCTSSLLITGHSAGGAVASLLWAHMHSVGVESELSILTGCFKRVHCITFGAPPVSFLPLQKPHSKRGDKSLFLSFANEGDPIVRADKEYVFSLAKLLAAPAPTCGPRPSEPKNTLAKKASQAVLNSVKSTKGPAPHWPVPSATLSNAGRMVLMREKIHTDKSPGVEAIMTTDEQLRDVVFGDPAMHMMSLYRQRVEKLAFAAMLGDEVVPP
ncbi:hypothetical protein LTR95_008553 [Oleoguttula sp. CCFEE 5521]